jgi:hypothetical protein
VVLLSFARHPAANAYMYAEVYSLWVGFSHSCAIFESAQRQIVPIKESFLIHVYDTS